MVMQPRYVRTPMPKTLAVTLLVVLLQLTQASGNCIPNAFINTLDVLYPTDSVLVHNPYYTKLSAEIVMDAAEFTKQQQQFHICATATMDIGTERVEIYKECGRSVFGQGAVYGREGVNYLELSLHHNDTKLCEVNVTVHCCADNVSAGAVLEAKKQATLNSFLRTGSEFELRILQGDALTIQYESPSDRLTFSAQAALNVVIGIKSSAMYSAKRQSMRSSWFKQVEQLSSSNVHIVPLFLVGNSTLAYTNATINRLLVHEQLLYQDMLLADELPVTDSYRTLGQKVLAFMKWLSEHSWEERVDYVIMCDDDVFVDVWQLKEFLMHLQQQDPWGGLKFYGGEVLEKRMHEVYHPIRDAQHRNHLSEAHYPLSVLPPFALGNFYILGNALWRYVAANADVLQPTGTLEDLSVGVWMMGLQVFPVHLSGVCDISRCLYESSIYVADNATAVVPVTTDTPAADGASGDSAWAPRLLAVADLQESSEFSLLDQAVSYRESHQWGNNQESLSLMKSVITHLSHLSTQRNFQVPPTPAPAPPAPAAPLEYTPYEPQQRTLLACSTCSAEGSVRQVRQYAAQSRPLRLAIVLQNMWYTEENVCLLELVRCDLSKHHVVEIVTNTIVADVEVLELLKQAGVAVRYFDELSVENHKKTAADEDKAKRFLEYLSTFDVMIEVSGADTSGAVQEVRDTLHKLREDLQARVPGHGVVPLLIIFTDKLSAHWRVNYQGATKWHQHHRVWSHSAPGASPESLAVSSGVDSLAEAVDKNLCITVAKHEIDSNAAQLLSQSHKALPQQIALSTVYLEEISVIVGAQSHYAAGVLDRLLSLAFPSYRVVHRYSLHISKYDAATVLYEVSRQFEVLAELSAEEVLALQAQKTVLLLTVLDCTTLDMSQTEAAQQLRWTPQSQQCLDTAVSVTNATSVLFLSGEPADLSSMQAERVDLLLSTTTSKQLLPPNAPVHYFPVHVASFFEMKQASSLDLLLSASTRSVDGQCEVAATCVQTSPKSRGVAYLYHRCDRTQREQFFRIVQDKLASEGSELAVEALGRCSGGRALKVDTASAATAPSPVSSRFQSNYLDLAVDVYRPFKFVIAFENSVVDGYITEKLTTAYLAGAVPVYFGAPDVSDYFNPHSMINCGGYASLAECAHRVLEVQRNETLYQEMLLASPIINVSAWARLFPWERQVILSAEAKEFTLFMKKCLDKLTL